MRKFLTVLMVLVLTSASVLTPAQAEYVRNDPVNNVDPNGQETLALNDPTWLFNLVTPEQMYANPTLMVNEAKAAGGFLFSAASLAVPGPEDLAIAAAGATKIGRIVSEIVENVIDAKAGFKTDGQRIIVDENFAGRAPELRELGVNARGVDELGMRGADDATINSVAETLGAKVLTSDKGSDIAGGFGQNAIRVDDRVKNAESLKRILDERN